MNKYIENPKMKGSGMYGCIPQKGECPNDCADCFYNGGRSYLEPLNENTPNMPDIRNVELYNRVVRVNDGNDSNNNQALVISKTKQFTMKFYNTSIPKNLEVFDAPIVLTINPGNFTDISFYKLHPIPKNLMFIRIRVNTWNLELVKTAIMYYTQRKVPIVLTFMAYHKIESILPIHRKNYIYRDRTLNKYYAITTKAWKKIMNNFKYNKYVYSCGKIEGEMGDTHCRFCGNCIREYFACMERLRDGK